MKSKQPVDLKWRHFQGEIILQGVPWYCKYGISYRDLEEMVSERGLSNDHTTLYRWFQHYTPLQKNKLEWYQKHYSTHWHIDETYIRVKGGWK